MKKIINILLVAIAFMVVGTSCQKEGLALEKPFVDINFFGKGAYITLNKTVNVNLNFAQLATSKVSVMVDPYNNGVTIKQVKLYAVKGTNADPKAWKLVKTVDINGTTELSATGSELATAFGVTLANLVNPGEYFTFYNQVVTADGKTFDLSNTLGALENATGYNACFRWSAYVVCPFTGGMAGKYKVMQDDWVDWNKGDIVNVTDGAAGEINLSQVWPNPAYGAIVSPGFIVKVDPATGTASLKSTAAFAAYGYKLNASSLSGYVFSCTGYIGLRVGLYAAGYGDQGVNALVLQKQ